MEVNNKICEYLGWTKFSDGVYIPTMEHKRTLNIENNVYAFESIKLDFFNNYDWVMLIVNKLESDGWEVISKNNECIISKDDLIFTNKSYTKNSRLNSLYWSITQVLLTK